MLLASYLAITGFDYHFAPSYDATEDAGAFGVALVLSSFGGVASIVL